MYFSEADENMKYGFFTLLFLSIFFATSCNDSDAGMNSLHFQDTLIANQYHISVPEYCEVVPLVGPDFTVYYFKSKDKNRKLSFSGGFYLCNTPALLQSESNDCASSFTDCNLLGNEEQMLMYQCDGKYTMQAIVKSGLMQGQDSLHVFASTANKRNLYQLKAIFASLRVK